MCRTARVLVALALVALFATGSGCGRRPRSRTQVSGSVTADGRPVKVGQIRFTPTGGGSEYAGGITNGRYRITGRYGMPSGEYTVQIRYASSGTRSGGFDRVWTDRVSVGGFGTPAFDFER